MISKFIHKKSAVRRAASQLGKLSARKRKLSFKSKAEESEYYKRIRRQAGHKKAGR